MCAVEICEAASVKRGWCIAHYTRWRRYGDPEFMVRPYRAHGSPQERFWAKVEKTETCWLWTASTRNGYSWLGLDGRCEYGHRLVYEWLVGPIPEGLHIDHLCRNRACVNPAHLEAVSQRENNVRSGIARREKRKVSA